MNGTNLKAVILCGGKGTRLGEETSVKPKPMVSVGGLPILLHIMKIYSHYGVNEFIILLGYKGYLIKEYFANYYLHRNDLVIDLTDNSFTYLNDRSENWKITLLDTGLETMTGARIKKVKHLLKDETFFLTYGDGLSDVNIQESLNFHQNHGKLLTMTAVQPEGRFGALNIKEDNKIDTFKEKPQGDGAWVNGGFFVCEPGIFEYINDSEDEVFEKKPLENIAKANELVAYKHNGFWQPMDTLRDKVLLDELAKSNAPWMNLK